MELNTNKLQDETKETKNPDHVGQNHVDTDHVTNEAGNPLQNSSEKKGE